MEELICEVTNYLIGQQGTISHPKSDGRVEIPQLLIKKLGWDKKQTAYIKFYNDELLVYTKQIEDNSKNIWIYRITNGRIRIPVSVLRSANLNNKPLYLAIGGENIIIKSKTKSEKIQSFISSLSPEQIKLLYSVFIPEYNIDNIKIDKPDLVDNIHSDAIKNMKNEEDSNFLISVQNVDKAIEERSSILEDFKPELILPDITQPTVFKIVGGPFTFPVIWSENCEELVLPSKGSSDEYIQQLYIIPGIRMLKKSMTIGFLLVQESVFSNIREKVLNNKKDFPEIILWYDSFVDGNFKVYLNPSTDVDTNLIITAQNLCKEPLKFVEQNFRNEEFDDVCSKQFPVLTSTSNIRK